MLSCFLDPFVKYHLFETSAFLLESIKLHYTKELTSQAAKILGSVDFLGNPIGLFSDMAEGVSCLLEGNVPGMLKNVTRGVSNTAAKVCQFAQMYIRYTNNYVHIFNE